MFNHRKQGDYNLCGRLYKFIDKQVIRSKNYRCSEKHFFFTNVDQVRIAAVPTGVQ
jgi:hypothetical protein